MSLFLVLGGGASCYPRQTQRPAKAVTVHNASDAIKESTRSNARLTQNLATIDYDGILQGFA